MVVVAGTGCRRGASTLAGVELAMQGPSAGGISGVGALGGGAAGGATGGTADEAPDDTTKHHDGGATFAHRC